MKKSAMLAAITISLTLPITALCQEVTTHSIRFLPRVEAALTNHKPLTIIAFGSSSTRGVGATSIYAAYPNQLELQIHALIPNSMITVINQGINGEDADDMIIRIDAIIAKNPDLIIWQTGTNDVLKHVPLERFIQETKWGIQKIQEAGIDLMMMESQYCPFLEHEQSAPTFLAALRQLSQEAGVDFIPRYTWMQEWDSSGVLTNSAMIAPDGLHMTDASYALLAQKLAFKIIADAHQSTYLPTQQVIAKK